MSLFFKATLLQIQSFLTMIYNIKTPQCSLPRKIGWSLTGRVITNHNSPCPYSRRCKSQPWLGCKTKTNQNTSIIKIGCIPTGSATIYVITGDIFILICSLIIETQPSRPWRIATMFKFVNKRGELVPSYSTSQDATLRGPVTDRARPKGE